MKVLIVGLTILAIGCMEKPARVDGGKNIDNPEVSPPNDVVIHNNQDNLDGEQFLKEFYDSYFGACLDDLQKERVILDSLIMANCTEQFRRWIKTIDWDPLLNAQDCSPYSVNDYTIETLDAEARIYHVNYKFYEGHEAGIDIILQLVVDSDKLWINQSVASIDELK